jgi:hypothetical protein
MEFILEERTLDISMMKFSDMLESNMSDFLYTLAESQEVVTESKKKPITEFAEKLKAKKTAEKRKDKFEEFKKKASEIIQKALVAIAEFFQKVKVQIEIQVNKIKLNKKLSELKDLMAKKRAKAVNKSFSYFDIRKYKDFYTQFINKYTAELIKGLNTDFKTIEEYEKWRSQMVNKLSDFNYKLSDEEQWKLSIAVNSAVELSEKEAENRSKNLKMVEEEGSRAIKELDSFYKHIDVEHSQIDYEEKRWKLFRLKNSFIGFICSKIAQLFKTVVHIITKHTFACVTALIVVLIAL